MGDALFRELFLSSVPLLDVRAEVEFARGAFPGAVNMPILNDAERQQVGTCYRHRGPAAAVALGNRLVSGETRQARVAAWRAFLDEQPSAHLYCFRGGQRSAIAVQWLAETGIRVPRVPGGFKALRRFLIDSLERVPPAIVLAGGTGAGKTAVLRVLARSHPRRVVDLEAHANHRGSAFGGRGSPQPTQINFENALAIAFLDLTRPVLLEDEGKLIGRLLLPLPLQERMNRAPVIVLHTAAAERVENIRNEYVVEPWLALRAREADDETALECQQKSLYGALDAIRKRLGGAEHGTIRKLMEAAFHAQAQGDFCGHDAWIERLLRIYYDPMYDYQLAQKSTQVVFSGAAREVCEYASTLLDSEDTVA